MRSISEFVLTLWVCEELVFDPSAVYSTRRSELLRKRLFVPFSVLLVSSSARLVFDHGVWPVTCLDQC